MSAYVNLQIKLKFVQAFVAMALLGGAVSGCASAVVGAGATAGMAVLEDRTMEVIARDTTIATKIRLNLVNAGEKYVTGISVEVYESRVLMTGAVANDQMRAEAIRLSWKVENVEDVLNEIQIADSGIKDLAKDTWITTQITSKMTLDRDILAINYNVETVNGVVYMIGLAQSQEELDRVISHMRSISGVQRIINHVRVKKATS